mgnify:CR=1 FL=1
MTELNIYQRLSNVRKTCSYLKKENDGYQFKYVSSSQTLGHLHNAINENGLILVPEIVSQDVNETTNSKGNKEFFTKLNMRFTWVNIDKPSDTVVCFWTGQGIDNAEKGIGKALTYAEKYFLLKFFNIATDKDDPDKFQEKMDKQEVKTPAKSNEQLEMQKDFTQVFKNGTVYQWSNLMTKWLKKKPELANNKEFESWVNKYKPASKTDEELMLEASGVK